MRLRRLLGFELDSCVHVPTTHSTPRADRCEECGARFSLRVCSTCGHVGCCDSQAGHARTHSYETGHPVMYALTRVGRGFTWCYPDNRYVSGEREAAV